MEYLRQTTGRQAVERLVRREQEQGAMAPPPPPPAKKCFVADCPYLTSEGLTFEQQLLDIDAHAKYIHRELTIPAPSAPSSAPKPTALP